MNKKVLLALTAILLSVLISCETKKEPTLEEIVREKAKPAYLEAYKKILELKNNIQLADSGLIDKSRVLNQFNQSLSPVMGEESTFEGLKLRIDTAGDDYTKMMYDKESARIAMEMAAESNLKLEEQKKH